jgi:hypothetical protein
MTTLPTLGQHIDGQAGGNPLVLTGANAFTPGSMLIATAVYIASVTPPDLTGWTRILAPVTIGTRAMVMWAKIRDAADGDSYSFNFSATNAKRITIAEFLGTDGVIANLVVGAFRNRAGSGGTFTNIANSITTPVDNCLVATFSGEATSATEASLPVVTGATKWYDGVQSSTSAIEQVTVATQTMPTAGATAAVNITYPNTQSANGGAIQIGMRPVPDVVTPPNPTTQVQAELWDGTNLTKYNVSRMNADGVTESPMAAVELQVGVKQALTARLTNPAPLYIAHRGGSANWPEHSPQAYWESGVIYNMDALEVSVHKSADGTFWCSHDTTTTRATGVTGTIASMTDAQLAALNNIAGNTDNPSQPSSPFLRFADMLAKYAGKRILFIEDKTYANQAAVIALAGSYASSDWFVWKQAGPGNKNAGSVTAGWKSWGYFFEGDMAGSFASKQAQWDFVGLDYNSSDATLAAAIATAGAARVIPHILPSAAQRDRMLGFGVRGMMIANVRDIVAKGSAFAL